MKPVKLTHEDDEGPRRRTVFYRKSPERSRNINFKFIGISNRKTHGAFIFVSVDDAAIAIGVLNFEDGRNCCKLVAGCPLFLGGGGGGGVRVTRWEF